MSYNTKNYTEPGGEKTVIGGELEVKEGARVTGLPSSAANQAASTATTVAALKDDFNALLTKLKDSGVVVPDSWNFTTRIAPSVSGVGGRNNGKTAVSIDGTSIAITVDVADLEEYDSGASGQGVHKWTVSWRSAWEWAILTAPIIKARRQETSTLPWNAPQRRISSLLTRTDTLRPNLPLA